MDDATRGGGRATRSVVVATEDDDAAGATAMDAAMQAQLSKLGHKLSRSDRDYGNMQAILWDRDHRAVSAASDPRGEGTAAVLVVAPR